MCHHPDKFGDHSHCDSAELIIFICNVTSNDMRLKGYVILRVQDPHGKSPPCLVWYSMVKCK